MLKWMNVFKGSKGPFWTLETIAIFIKWGSKHCKVWRDFNWVFWGPAIEWSQIGSMSRHISCPLIGASLACPDRRGDRDVGSGWGNRPSNQQRERLSGGVICIGRLHFALRNLNGQNGTNFGNLLVWPAPDSLIPYFLGISPRLAIERFLSRCSWDLVLSSSQYPLVE